MDQGDGARQDAGHNVHAASGAQGMAGNDAGQRTPTPPYPATAAHASMPTPVQRLAETRASVRRASRSAHPDGTPAPLPLGAGWGSGGVARVTQRFSGSGVTSLTRVQRQERRARTTTLALAGAAVLLTACSALLLFNPTILHSTFGFGPGQRLVKQNSNVPLIVPGDSPTPTSTPTSSAAATPTPLSTATPTPSSAATPSPTPRPTPTSTLVPTATPTLSASAATVKFTAAEKTVGSGAMSACPSGCNVPSYSTGTHLETWYSDYWDYDQYSQTQLHGILYITNWNEQDAFSGAMYDYLFNFRCDTDSFTLPPGYTHSGVSMECDFNNIASDVTIHAGDLRDSGAFYNNYTGNYYVLDYTNPNDYSSYGNWNLSGGRCGSAENEARQIATNVENNWLSGQMSGSGRQEVDRAVWGPNWQLCTPSGQQFAAQQGPTPSTRGEAQMSGHALGFYASDAQSFAQSQLTLPNGYYWTAGATNCASLSWANVNPNDYNSPFTITCPVSRHADYDWRSTSSAGQQAQGSLISQIASKPGQPVSKAQAISICQANAGIAGTCSITIQGGDGQTMPLSNITIQAFEP